MLSLLTSAMSLVTQKTLTAVRQTLNDRCTRILLMYRRNCSSGVPAGQVGQSQRLS